MPRSRIALLQRAMDVVFGDTIGSQTESGWAQGTWRKQTRSKVHVCLNSALHAAERDLFIGDSDIGPENGMRTQEGIETQELLAETILEMYPDMDLSDGQTPQSVIIAFNDNHADVDSMDAVLRKTEDKAFAKWLEQNPTWKKSSQVSQSFIDYAMEGNAS